MRPCYVASAVCAISVLCPIGPDIAGAQLVNSPLSETNDVVSQFVVDYDFKLAASVGFDDFALNGLTPWTVDIDGAPGQLLVGPNPSFVFPADGLTTLSQQLHPNMGDHLALRVVVEFEALSPQAHLNVTVNGNGLNDTQAIPMPQSSGVTTSTFVFLRQALLIGVGSDDLIIEGADIRLYSIAIASIDRNAEKADMILTGVAEGDLLGGALAAAGDVDADGFADVIIGAYRNDDSAPEAGQVYVVSGRTGETLYSYAGEALFDFFGVSVAGAGDVNADGHDDIIVGAFFHNTTLSDVGAAYVYSGADGSLLRKITGAAPLDFLGGSVAGAGDVNGDGFDDVIVGAEGRDLTGADAGAAYVYSGQDWTVLHEFNGESGGDHFGVSVDGAGDVNDDGYDDVIVGAVWNSSVAIQSGRAYVFSGATGEALHVLDGDVQDARFGISVTGLGDIDADGGDDFAIGSPRITEGISIGRAVVYSGLTGQPIYDFSGEQYGDFFGIRVDTAGDADNDGTPDILVGASEYSGVGSSSGRAYIISGATGEVLNVFSGQASFDRFGIAIAGAGDIDGNGFDDLLIGAVKNSAGGKDAGRAYVFRTSEMGVIIPPVLDSVLLTESTIERGEMLQLSASLSGGSASAVEFYMDQDHTGDIDPEFDLLLAVDGDPSDGWSVEIDSETLAAGSWDVLVRARSSEAAAMYSTTGEAGFTLFELCRGDYSGDRIVDGADLAVVLYAISGGGVFPEFDVTGDGLVTGAEISILLANWGGCP